MTKKLLLLICFSTLLFSCSKKETWQLETKTYLLKTSLPCKGDECSYVEFNIPTIISEDENLKKINQIVLDTVKKHIGFESNASEIKNYEDLAHSFINSYDEIKRAFPNEPLPWEASVDGTFEIFNSKSINIVLNYYTFTGGAHGNEGVISLFYNLENGKSITQKDLFLDYEGFKKIAERDFRTSMNLSPTDDINKNGNLFKDKQFSLPQNIIITQNEIILHYNKYEIAPYSSGTTILKFPMKTFKKYLNPLYF